MNAPHLADDAFLADVAAARSEAGTADDLHLWWLGQSGFLVLWQGHALLFDPYLSDSLTRKYAATDKPHDRVTGRVIAPERLDFVEVVTSTHMHTDHLDAETLTPLLAASPGLTLVVPEANRVDAAARLGVDLTTLASLDAGERLQAGVFHFSAVPAAHEQLERDAAGRYKFLGYIVQAGPWSLYHSGDTVRYERMADLLRPHAIDIALLPINGSAPGRRVAGNLNGAEAAQLAHEIGARLVIPCHYDMFSFNTATPDDFVATCQALGQPFCVLRNGERWSGRHGDLAPR